MLFCATRCVVDHENTQREWCIVIKAYKLTVFEILRYLCVCTIPTFRVYQSLVVQSQSEKQVMDSFGNIFARISHGCWDYGRELHCYKY